MCSACIVFVVVDYLYFDIIVVFDDSSIKSLLYKNNISHTLIYEGKAVDKGNIKPSK